MCGGHALPVSVSVGPAQTLPGLLPGVEGGSGYAREAVPCRHCLGCCLQLKARGDIRVGVRIRVRVAVRVTLGAHDVRQRWRRSPRIHMRYTALQPMS